MDATQTVASLFRAPPYRFFRSEVRLGGAAYTLAFSIISSAYVTPFAPFRAVLFAFYESVSHLLSEGTVLRLWATILMGVNVFAANRRPRVTFC